MRGVMGRREGGPGSPWAEPGAHLEGDVLAGLGEGVSQEEHVVHTDAEGQEG